jgi:hypothetical protein
LYSHGEGSPKPYAQWKKPDHGGHAGLHFSHITQQESEDEAKIMDPLGSGTGRPGMDARELSKVGGLFCVKVAITWVCRFS